MVMLMADDCFYCRVILLLLLINSPKVIGYDELNGELRLMPPSSRLHRPQVVGGRVEMYRGSCSESNEGNWGTIQYSSTIDQSGVAQVVCRQLGYYGYVRVGTVTSLNYSNASSDTSMLLREVDCPYNKVPGNALQHILRCKYENVPTALPVDHGLDLAVECTRKSRDFDPYDGQIRLLQGNGNGSGFVEVYLNHRWGPVCYMSRADSLVACRQLGYNCLFDHDGTKDGFLNVNEEQVSDFTCDSDYGYGDYDDDVRYHACLRSCYKYPKSNFSSADCSMGFSYIACAFDEPDHLRKPGSASLCSASPLTDAELFGTIMGAVVLGFLFLVAMVAVCICCCCIRSCPCYNVFRKRATYEVIQ